MKSGVWLGNVDTFRSCSVQEPRGERATGHVQTHSSLPHRLDDMPLLEWSGSLTQSSLHGQQHDALPLESTAFVPVNVYWKGMG